MFICSILRLLLFEVVGGFGVLLCIGCGVVDGG